MTKKIRPERVAELIREEIASLLMKGVKDPRIGFVSVMGVKLSPDLHYANVYVSLFGDEATRKSSLVGLQRSAGWMRRELGKAIRMRFTPEIRFFPDDSLDRVYHLEEVFEKIHHETGSEPMRPLDLAGVIAELRAADSLLLTTHENPDGDAVGSLLGLWHFVRALGKKKAVCVCADPAPRIYRFLPGLSEIVDCSGTPPDYDLAVIIDTSPRVRIGKAAEWIPEDKPLMILDHHLDTGPAGAMGLIDSSYAAAGEIVAELFNEAAVPLTPEAAVCLYVAQITDTGGYRFSGTNARSHRIAAALYETGINASSICARVFDEMSMPKFELLKRVLDRIEFAANGRIAHTHVTLQDVEEARAKKEDLNNLINYARNLEGVRVGMLCHATGPETTKVSLRAAPGFDAAAFLAQFGGGGHAAAAGTTMNVPLLQARDMVLERLEAALEQDA